MNKGMVGLGMRHVTIQASHMMAAYAEQSKEACRQTQPATDFGSCIAQYQGQPPRTLLSVHTADMFQALPVHACVHMPVERQPGQKLEQVKCNSAAQKLCVSRRHSSCILQQEHAHICEDVSPQDGAQETQHHSLLCI
jgi:hypothetical protein